MCHENILDEIERLRLVMYKLAEEGAPYDKLLAASRKIDILIVKFQKHDIYDACRNAPLQDQTG